MKRKVKTRASSRRSFEGPVFRANPRDSMRDWLEEQLQALPELEVRAMFGGAGIYSAGTLFGILHAGRVYFKTDASTRAAFEDRGMAPFRPPRGAVLKNYYEVPAAVLDDDSELLSWARRALAMANEGPRSRGRRRS